MLMREGPGWWWSLAQCAFSLITLGLVLYIYRAQLKPAGFCGRCQHALALPSVIHTGDSHHTQTPQYSLSVMACQSFKRTPAKDLISLHAERLTRHAGGIGVSQTHTLPRGAGKRRTHALPYQPGAWVGDKPMPFQTNQPHHRHHVTS